MAVLVYLVRVVTSDACSYENDGEEQDKKNRVLFMKVYRATTIRTMYLSFRERGQEGGNFGINYSLATVTSGLPLLGFEWTGRACALQGCLRIRLK